MLDKLAVSATEAAKMLDISRPTLYTLIRRDDFPSFKIGTRTLIPVKSLQDWVEKQANGGDDCEQE